MGDTPQRLHRATRMVLEAMLDSDGQDTYCFELHRRLGLSEGTIAPMLARLARAGWLTARREDVDPMQVKRGARLLYAFTPAGAAQARRALAAAAHGRPDPRDPIERTIKRLTFVPTPPDEDQLQRLAAALARFRCRRCGTVTANQCLICDAICCLECLLTHNGPEPVSTTVWMDA